MVVSEQEVGDNLRVWAERSKEEMGNFLNEMF